ISIDLEPRPEEREEPPPPEKGEVHLGDAAFPAGNPAAPVQHPWWVKRLEPTRYRLGYKVPEPTASQLREDYHRYARSVGHRRLDKNRFQWSPPARCFGGLHCVYEELIEEGREPIAPISALFEERARVAKLSSLDAAELVLTFVQEVRYEIPDDEPFGVLPPPLVVRLKYGDCDSKSLLGHMILARLGIDSVLISSEAHKHTMLGVALPAPGTSFEWQGRRYAFVETTAKHSPIGHINPQLLRPNDWRVVAMRVTPPIKTTPSPIGADNVIGGAIRIP
ncbi:MAG TPA: hypothetical protein VFB62_19625, partial [Polyangiaceae bacterium]|nr:hypothetical protein [Polyangiaceae bacterium]